MSYELYSLVTLIPASEEQQQPLITLMDKTPLSVKSGIEPTTSRMEATCPADFDILVAVSAIRTINSSYYFVAVAREIHGYVTIQ